jgi:hypothetical protein
MILREIEKVRFIMKEATGLDICYAYDDVVFAENAVYIVCFDDNDNNLLHCYFNRECIEDVKLDFQEKLVEIAKLNGVTMNLHGVFDLKQKEDSEEMEVHLFEKEVVAEQEDCCLV